MIQKDDGNDKKSLKDGKLIKKMQDFLRSQEINKEKTIFLNLCSRMENFGENFRGKRDSIICPLCANHKDTKTSVCRNGML